MEEFTLRQGDVIAKISNLRYRPDEGFQEDNTWHVDEASIAGESDKKLTNGSASLEYGGKKFPITVSVFEVDIPQDDEDEDDEFPNPVCEIEIGYTEGVKQLAKSLGLL